VARATPAGRGGIAVIRVSGPDTLRICATLAGRVPARRQAVHRVCRDGRGRAIDDVLLIYFPRPDSFTGEDVLEIQCHGSPLVCDMLIERILEVGARLAQPGEFSQRAYLNDRLDLSQAEAIADLIDSGSRAAARAAQRSLAGDFSRAVLSLSEAVTSLRVWVEAAIDFPDEDVDFLSDHQLRSRVDDVGQAFASLQKSAVQGSLLRDGIVLVLAGRPNAGKSSLLNKLAGRDTAIVTDTPGTTRDLVREHIDLDGLPVHVIDTAGLRDGAGEVELEGIRRAKAQLAVADHALLIVDATREDSADDIGALAAELPGDLSYTLVRNKIDLSGEPAGLVDEPEPAVNISAATGEGMAALRGALRERVGFVTPGDGSFTARRRHVDALRRASEHFDEGCRLLIDEQAGELMADELAQAQKALGEIVGEFTNEDLLGEIFGRFCIGK
jgi:tRNA modification GTPase